MTKLTRDEVDACMPEEYTPQDFNGNRLVTLDWLHDFAKAVELKAREHVAAEDAMTSADNFRLRFPGA